MEITINLNEETINRLVSSIANAIQNVPNKNERLYNKTEICKIVGVPVRTFSRYNVPSHSLSKNGRKLYSLPDVKEYLKR